MGKRNIFLFFLLFSFCTQTAVVIDKCTFVLLEQRTEKATEGIIFYPPQNATEFCITNFKLN